MSKNWYREALEALGMTGKPDPISNRLNAVIAQTEDPVLRELAVDVLRQFKEKGNTIKHTCIRNSHGVKSTKLDEYCQRQVRLAPGP